MSNARDTRNNERWVVDRLIDAVEAGDTDAKLALGQRLLHGIWEDGWTAWKRVEEGLYLPFATLDPLNIRAEDLEILREESEISEAEPAFRDGAPLSGNELRRWREFVVERAFSPETADIWACLETHLGLRRVYVAATLRQPDEQVGSGNRLPTFVAAFETFGEVMNALKSQGFVGPKDYEARSGELPSM